MNAITRLRNPMLLLTGAAGLYALGLAIGVIGYATFSGRTLDSYNTFGDLLHASDWLQFVGALLALAAVATAGWETMAQRVADQQIEIAVAALATLMIAIGALVQAASSISTSTAEVLTAIGVGIWALLALSRAARLNLAQQQGQGGPAGPIQQLLAATAGTVLLAVATGIDVGVTDQGAGIAVGIMEALAFGLLAWSIVSARPQGFLAGVPTQWVTRALAVLVIAGLTDAVVAALVFTPHGTLKGLRIGGSLALAARVLGVATLGWAAWIRVGELVSGRPATPGPSGGWSWTPPGTQPPPPPAGPGPTDYRSPQNPPGAPPATPATPTGWPKEPAATDRPSADNP